MVFDSEIILSLGLSFPFALRGVFLCVSFESNKLTHQILVYIHDCSIVIKVTTVILCTENCYELLVFTKETVAVLHYLMASANQI
jgi:hypothetical protein